MIIIRKTDELGYNIQAPQRLYQTLKKCNTVAFGSKKIACSISNHQVEDALYLSKPIWNELGLTKEQSINLFHFENTLYLGPLVGILTAGFTGSLLRPVGSRSMFFAKLLEVEQAVGIQAFIFGAHHINWEKGTVNGYFHSHKGWLKREVPFPNVIYNRLPNRKTENLEELQRIKTKLENEYAIPMFNPSFFHKWEVHEILNKDPIIKPFLPETIKGPTFRDIKTMISKYGHIYLKPANGSLGLGIFQIIHSQKDDCYYCRFRDNEQNKLRKYRALDVLIADINKERNLHFYLAQQGIFLLRVDKKQMDFRIHTNKNKNGEWVVSAIAAKIAGLGSATTHLRNGGEIKTLEEVFPDDKKREHMFRKLKEAVLPMSMLLDRKIPGTIGEIGFDIGIDKEEHIWLFEANSKPGRSIFKHPHLKKDDFLSRQLPMEYAVFLSEQAIKQPERLFEVEPI